MERMRAAYGMQNTSAADLRAVRAAYLGKVSYSDWLLGELMEALERTGRAKDTALFVLSDHGDYAGDYGLVEKWPSGMEDCLTHIPFIARVPGGTAKHVVAEQTQLFDVMATCLDLAGVEARHTHFARSLVPQLQGAAGDPKRASFIEGGYNIYEPQCFEPVPPKDGAYYPRLNLHHTEPETVSRCTAIKTHQYRFVSRPQGDSELYLLHDDPLEKNNLYGDKSVQGVQQEAMERLLHWYVDTTGIAPWGTDSRDFPPYIPHPDFSASPSAAEILDNG
jgi:choline-sulfatase